jgi:NDP-sugar pyrophosphorylase family protein
LTHKADTSHYGRVSISNDGTIIRFEEKNDTVRPGWINSGIYILKQIMLQSIPTGREVSLERETFPAWVGQGLYGYQSKGRFLDIGTPESYALAHNFFASEKMP